MHSPFDMDPFLAALSRAFKAELPGQDAQFEMAPIDRQDHEGARIQGKPCKEAAVLALFFPPDEDSENEEVHLLLTVRPQGLSDHAGQIAFPGGRRELEEALMETALRETEEEVFIPRHLIRIVGSLTPLYVPPSNFCVYPFVGVMQESPDLGISSDEVAEAFGVPVSHLLDPSLRQSMRRSIRGAERDIPYFSFDGQTVWGATAMILSELAMLLERGSVG